MFRLNYVILFLLVMMAKNCLAQSFTVGSKKYFTQQMFNTGRAYQFMQVYDSLSINSFYLNDQHLKANIESAINASFRELGYQNMQHDTQLLVKYQVLSAPARLHGSNTFSKNTDSDNINPSMFNVDPGTLVISLIDAADGKILWQGFASGFIDSQATQKNIVMVNKAVRLVMQEYASLLNNNSNTTAQ